MNWFTKQLSYFDIPLPTKKGIFWSGYDDRSPKHTRYDLGGFLRTSNGTVHKVIHGSSLSPALSVDGCKIAFFNTPRADIARGTSLKVLDVCESTVSAKELPNVDY